MEYAAGSGSQDPGQGHINLLPSNSMMNEAPIRQHESCHCCKVYNRTCLQGSSNRKKSDRSDLLEEYTDPRPEMTRKQEEVQDVYSDSLLSPSKLPMELKDPHVECLAPTSSRYDIELCG